MKIMLVCSGQVNKNLFQCASWVEALIDKIQGIKSYQILVCYSCVSKTIEQTLISGVTYIGVPRKRGIYRVDRQSQLIYESIMTQYKPEVIHLCGTEYPYSLEVVTAAKNKGMLEHIVVIIQGLCSKIAEHYMDCIPWWVRYGFTLRDFIRFDNVYMQKKKMEIRGMNEIKALRLVNNISGRTEWDCSCTYLINPKRRYYKCNEFLRDIFYQKQWKYDECEKHTLFVSQSYYTIKGFGVLLDAVGLLLKDYPDIKIYTTGTRLNPEGPNWKIDLYTVYLKKKISKMNLENRVIGCGQLSAEEMCNRYLKCNVFVSPSMIENSSNSVGEAMLLGCPIISSYVGGITDFIVHKQNGYLYQPNAAYMLAYYIRKIFENNEETIRLASNARMSGMKVFDRMQNFDAIKRMYEDIVSITKIGE
ncbi:hypothetical protein B5F08_11420 [Anaeromassilibacillus sp. An172]|uniref:glycosyltransferase family 4 protein n=1 Tax=Anaeromassilibacillus sp. An172 TaxID=1965570 RepID=UPI000B36DC6B|nr:glycosyltransferase [Anaeromassilibacillus sp. An172]OUP75317.1 hypothetical protein B5F08_11420 [Anaeromassilibacillus sp. An172]